MRCQPTAASLVSVLQEISFMRNIKARPSAGLSARLRVHPRSVTVLWHPAPIWSQTRRHCQRFVWTIKALSLPNWTFRHHCHRFSPLTSSRCGGKFSKTSIGRDCSKECSTWGTIVDILEQGGWAKKHLIISQVVDTCTIYYLCYCPSANDWTGAIVGRWRELAWHRQWPRRTWHMLFMLETTKGFY